jgi:WD40 repeat protein
LLDARSFVNGSREVIELSTPHIYLSALALCQQESRIKKEFGDAYGGIPLAWWDRKQNSQSSLVRVNKFAYENHVSATEGNTVGVHTGAINSVAFSSADGRYIVSGSCDNTVCVRDAQRGLSIMELLQGHTRPVNSVAFSRDGKYIVSGSDDSTVRLWNAPTGGTEANVSGLHTERITSVTFSPDGKYIVSGSYDKTVCVWNTQTKSLAMPPLHGHTDAVMDIGFSPDGKYIVSASSDQTVRMWNAQTGTPMKAPLRGHTKSVNTVRISSDSKTIISGSDDKTVRVWDAQTGKTKIEPFRGHTDSIRSVAFSPDDKHIISGSSDQTVRVWIAETGLPATKPLQGHVAPVTSVGFSPDGKYIVSGSSDNKIRVWDWQSTKTDTICFSPYPNHGFPHSAGLFDPSSTNRDDDFRDSYTFNSKSGWIFGPSKELFLWIPVALRSSLWPPRTTCLLSEGVLCLDLSEYACGSKWESCHRPLKASAI